MFYPRDAKACVTLAGELVNVGVEAAPAMGGGLGGIVPHAGWICSGAIAGEVLGTLARGAAAPPDVVVVFGAVHTPIDLRVAALASHWSWAVPGGVSAVARDLAELLERGSELFATDDRLHVREH